MCPSALYHPANNHTPPRIMKVAALDFETFYSKDYSIMGSSTYQYVNHPEFDAYSGIWSPKLSYVGKTSDFKDWKV